MSAHYLSVVALVIGASGLVGSAVMRALPGSVGTFRSRPVAGLRHLDALDHPGLAALMREIQPDVVYFPAAEPNVDWCEAEPEAAYRANVAPALDALETATSANARFVFFSSDYVFDGSAGPYDETAPVAPLSTYGRHKLEVEQRVLGAGATVVRTTTVFGTESPPGKNFVLRLAARLRAGEAATVPSDQFSTPTWADDLARGAVACAPHPGIWHVAGPDFLSRDRFAVLVADVFGLDASLIRPVLTSELQQAASRPMRGGLRTDKVRQLSGIAFSSTREALSRLR
ncbi:MAG: SDR family oxidoreductase [Chloroflexota bacterium]|nr:SDR family oxidoreductase [Chloroflexota bacterium]